MHRAVPPLDAGVVRRPSIRARLLATAALVVATACLDDPSSAPDDRSVHLAISAQVIGGRTVAIEVSYRSSGSGALVRLKSTPERVTVQPGTVQQPVTVDVTPCVNDPQRVRIAGREQACPLVIVLRLLDDDDDEIDSEVLEPEAPEPGETVTLPTVTLRQPELVLTPGSLAFEATKGGELPAVQVVEVGNGGGGSLGALSVEIDGGAEWLDASIGEGGSTVVVQPSTTALDPGTHEATVLVHSEGVGNSPRAIAITYEIAAIPTYALTILGDGTGTGRVTSEPDGIDCTITEGVVSGACSASFDEGTLVFLDGTVAEGSELNEWRGACEGDGGCAVTMTEARTVTATITLRLHTVVVNPSGNGSGRVVSEAAPIDCTIANGIASGTCTAQVPHGTSLTFEATPGTSSRFDGWDGACSGTGSCVIVVQDHATLIAAFSLVHHELAVTGAGGGDGTGLVTSAPAGIECVITGGESEGACSEQFEQGSTVTLTATPGEHSELAGWSGECSDASTTCTVSMTGAVTVTVTFRLVTHDLTVTGSGPGSGSVASEPGGIACTIEGGVPSGACAASFTHGTTVTLVPDPAANSVFVGWTGACSGSGPTCSVAMLKAETVGAIFDLVAVPLEVQGGGSGSGVVISDVPGIQCTITEGVRSGDCLASFPYGTSVVLTAEPIGASAFTGWSGDCTTTGQCVVTLTVARSVGAFFTAPAMLSVSLDGDGAGHVTSTPAGIACAIGVEITSNDCEEAYTVGTIVTLTASPTRTSRFVEWGGACSGSELTCVVTMSEARSVTATFGPSGHTLTVLGTGDGGGFITSDPDGIECQYRGEEGEFACAASFPFGTVVELFANADEEGFSVFKGWSGACGGEDECVLDMTSDLEVTASFQVEVPVAISGTGSGSGRVGSTPEGIDCHIEAGKVTGTCSARFPLGTVLTLRGTPDPGSVGGMLVEGTVPELEVTLEEQRTHFFAAQFDLDVRRIAIAGAGTGTGTVVSNPAGISCTITAGVPSGTCESLFPIESKVELVATPSGTDTFGGWTGGCTASGATCTFTVTGESTVTSTFHTLKTLTLELTGTGTGTVSVSPSDIICSIVDGKPGGTCSASFPHGTTVTLTAAPAAGMAHRWDGACLPFGTATDCTLTMDQAFHAIAVFSDPCSLIRPHVLFSSVEGEITTSDCQQSDGRYGDIHRLSLASQQLFQLAMSSPDMATELWIALGGGFWFSLGTQTSSHHILAPAGAFNIATQNNVPHDLGRYTLTSRTTDATGCLAIRTTFDVSADFVLQEGDCQYIASSRPTGASSPSDRVTIYVAPKQTLRVTVTSLDKAFEPLIELRHGTNDAIWDGELLGTTAGHAGGSFATLQFVGRDDGNYVQVWVTSRAVGGVGPYRIAIDEPSILPAATTELRAQETRLRQTPATSAGAMSGGGAGQATPLPPP